MNDDALFVRDGDGFLAAPHADGPWATGALHGGAPAALIAHRLGDEADARDLALARLTCEFVRPTPRGPLRIELAELRGGRRVALVEVTLTDPAGTVVTRARALLARAAALEASPTEPPPFPGPEVGAATDWLGERPMFATDAMEVRFVAGRFRAAGPATAWFRLRSPVLAGEPTRPADRVAATADFGNGISSELSWEEHTFINPDLTVHLERAPVDEWVALDARTRVRPGSVAVATSVLYDRVGRVGHATQTLIVERSAT